MKTFIFLTSKRVQFKNMWCPSLGTKQQTKHQSVQSTIYALLLSCWFSTVCVNQKRCSKNSFHVCSSRRGRAPGETSITPSNTNKKKITMTVMNVKMKLHWN